MKCEIEDKECTIKAYEIFYEEHQVELGHYFRYIYNIFKFINEHNKKDSNYKLDHNQFSHLTKEEFNNHGIIPSNKYARLRS